MSCDYAMKPQEEYNSIIWYVLQKIKQHHIHTQTVNLLSYDIHLLSDNNNELEILKKLANWTAIKIADRKLRPGFCVSVYLHTLQPRFNEIYHKFRLLQQPRFNYNFSQYYNNNRIKFSNNYKHTHFPNSYLFKEVERLELILKHFCKARVISLDDYEAINSKMIKIFLKESLYAKAIRKSSKQKKHRDTKQDTQNTKQQALPITGEIVVSGLNESLKALRQKESLKAGPRFPYKIPAGTYWNNVIIKFLNDEKVEIWVKRLKHIADFKEMGMVGKGKVPTPCEKWLFMKVLAKCYGELSIKDPEAKDKYKKQKQALTETLRNYFSIDYDPFYPYQSCPEKRGNSYKIKLTLIPPPEKNNLEQSIDNEDDADTLGINEFLNEEAPQVIDY